LGGTEEPVDFPNPPAIMGRLGRRTFTFPGAAIPGSTAMAGRFCMSAAVVVALSLAVADSAQAQSKAGSGVSAAGLHVKQEVNGILDRVDSLGSTSPEQAKALLEHALYLLQDQSILPRHERIDLIVSIETRLKEANQRLAEMAAKTPPEKQLR